MDKKLTSAEDYRAVAAMAARYVEALRTGNLDQMAGIFHPGAVSYGTVDGKLVGGAGNPAVDFIHQYGKSPDIVAQIDVLDLTPTTAVVRIVMERDAIGSDCTDFMTLIKLADGWSVTSKVFHQFDR